MTDLSESQLCRRVIDKLGKKWAAFQEVKSGSTWSADAPKRFDLLALKKSWSKPCIRIYEAKSNRQTFLNDQKWPKYMDYCNEFYWICPTGMIKKEEVDPRCGLVTINPESGAIHTRKKAIYRSITPESRADILMYLFMWRMDTKAIGMTREEQIALIQKDMKEDKEIGAQYAAHISKTLNEAANKYRKREQDLTRREAGVEDFRKWCKEMGMNEWTAKNAITKDRMVRLENCPTPMRLKNSLRNFIRDVNRMTARAEALAEILEEEK